MGLSVTVLGSGGTYAGVGNACSGFLVRSPTTSLLIDSGPGVLAHLQQHLDPRLLDGIVLTHSHPDHWLDIPVMRNAFRYVLDIKQVPLWLTAETLDMAERVVTDELTPTFVPEVITERSTLTVGDLTVRFSRTDHPVETLAPRVDHDGRSFAYTSDTGPGWSLAQLGAGIDLAISEATYLEGSAHETPVHLSAAQAGRLASEAGVARLVITHVLPVIAVEDAVAEASDAYGAPVEAALPHRTFQI